MKRLMIVLTVVGLAFVATRAVAGLSMGEKKKLGRYVAECLDPFASEKDRSDAWKEFTDYFDDRKKKDLAEIEDLSEVLAQSADRDSAGRTGVYEREFALSDIGMKSNEKWKYLVNVPKKYSGSSTSESWPLIVCLPDRDQDLEEYMDTYWADEDVRDSHLIVVLPFDYSDRTVTKEVPVTDDKGKIEYEEVEETVPFAWDSTEALFRFWKYMYNLQMREFKVDPNRIVLDGVGMGRDGAISMATGNTWRFAGLVIRGGEAPDSPTAQNLKYLSTLYLAPKAAENGTAGEDTEKASPVDAMRELLGDGLTVAEAGTSPMDWIEDVRRRRYPLPVTWAAVDPGEFFFYWGQVSKVFEADQPVKITVNADKRKNEITVDTENVLEFTLYLNDLLIDMDDEFFVIVNGVKQGPFTAERSADMLLQHAFAHAEGKPPMDPGCVFTNEIVNLRVVQVVDEDEEGGDDKDGEDK